LYSVMVTICSYMKIVDSIRKQMLEPGKTRPSQFV
jgi:hypothetical protein